MLLGNSGIHFPFLKYKFFFVSGNIYGRRVSSWVLSGGSSQFEISTALFQNLRISENENMRIVVSQVVYLAWSTKCHVAAAVHFDIGIAIILKRAGLRVTGLLGEKVVAD